MAVKQKLATSKAGGVASGAPGTSTEANDSVLPHNLSVIEPQFQAGSSGPNITIPKLSGKNYLNWRSIISDVIVIRGLDKVVFDREENNLLNLHAKVLIKSALDEAHLAEVRNHDKAHEIWSHLSRICIGANSCDITTLVRKFYNYKPVPGDSMSTHLEKLSTMREQLKNVNQDPTDEVFIDRILQTLPSEFDRLKESWDFMHPSQKTINELKSKVIAIEEKLKQARSEPESQLAFIVQKQGSRSKRPNIDERKRTTNCRKCGHKGHWAKECRTKPENYKKQPDQQQQREQHSFNQRQSGQSQADKHDAIFMVKHDPCHQTNDSFPQARIGDLAFKVSGSNQSLKHKWIADSGATMHMCNTEAWFTSINHHTEPKTVSVGDDSLLRQLGIGTVEVVSRVGNKSLTIKMEDVLLVPDLTTNLISLGRLDERGLVSKLAGGEITITKDERPLAHGCKVSNNLWLMNMEPLNHRFEGAYLVQARRTLDQWHKALGHAGRDRVTKAIKDAGLQIVGNNSDQEADCPDCPAGKGKHSSHPSIDRRAESVGERVFIDLAGPINTSLSGFNYFLLSKDEFSTYTHVYCLRDKAQTHLALAKLFAEFEVETGHRILRIHTDQGSEFMNNRTELLFAIEHAVHQTSATYTPQQNGMVEREIQSITQMARTMLLSADVPANLWDEAIKTACFIRNRLPNKNANNSPFEIATKRKPRLAHLCEFGRPVHVVIDDHYLKKFDARTEEGYIVGFTLRTNTYRVLLKQSQRVIESCNVIFRPHKQPQPKPIEQPFQTTVQINEPNAPSRKNPLDAYFEELEARGFLIDNSSTIEQNPSEQGENDVNTQYISMEQSDQAPGAMSEIESPGFSPLSNHERMDDAHQALLVTCNIVEPTTYKEALASPHSQEWIEAIEDEFNAHKRNGTWIIVDRPKQKSLMSTKWVFKVKTATDGSIERFKARLVARGFEQRAGFDYGETFAPVAKYETIRTLVALAAQFDLQIKQFDVTTAFLYGKLEEEVFIKPPEGMDLEQGKALKLIKGLYGLKQAPRVWNAEFRTQVESLGFITLKSDNCLFKHKTKQIYLCIYVDDGLILAPNEPDLDSVINGLKKVFDIKVIVNSAFVGLQIEKVKHGYAIHQATYAKEVLARHGMADSRPVTAPLMHGHRLTDTDSNDKDLDCPYREAIGALLYLATKTRPDILYAITMLAKFCQNPKEKHWTAIKRVMRYIRGTIDMGLLFKKEDKLRLDVFSDADWGSDAQNRKSITGTIIRLASGPVIFRSSQQNLVAMSTTEAEFVAAAESARDMIWLQTLLSELNVSHEKPELLCDSKTAIRLILNPEFPRRTKHIDIKFQFIRDLMSKDKFNLEYIASEEQLADFLTKALPRDKFRELVERSNILPLRRLLETQERGGVLG